MEELLTVTQRSAAEWQGEEIFASIETTKNREKAN